MRRSLKYIAFASASVFSCALMYKTRGDNKFGTFIYAAGDRRPRRSAKDPRPRRAFEIQKWNKNWDFREPNCVPRHRTPDKHSVPSLTNTRTQRPKKNTAFEEEGEHSIPSLAEIEEHGIPSQAVREEHGIPSLAEYFGPAERFAEEHSIPSLAEHFGEVDGQKQGLVKPTATRHLLFIRHGQYVKAEEDEKKVLTSLGRQQAGETANRLKMLHSNNNKIDKIVVSSMVRARETGEIIRNQLSGVPYEYCDFLTEGAPCIPEPPSSSYKPESYEESARIEAAFRKYIHRAELEQKTDSTEVYVGHANVIRYFVCRALQFPPEGWLRMSIDNCGITRLTIKPNGHVSLQSMGDTGHLHPKLITRN